MGEGFGGGSDANEKCEYGEVLARLRTHLRSIRVPYMIVVGDEDQMRRKGNVISAYRVGRSEAFQCARLSRILRVAVFGAQHHCAACCAVFVLPLILCGVGMPSALPTAKYNTVGPVCRC